MKAAVSLHRKFTTTATKLTLNAANSDKRSNYYKNLGQQQSEEVVTEEWKNARPYTEIPGPQALPIIGNNWRFFPLIGEFYNLEMVNLHET